MNTFKYAIVLDKKPKHQPKYEIPDGWIPILPDSGFLDRWDSSRTDKLLFLYADGTIETRDNISYPLDAVAWTYVLPLNVIDRYRIKRQSDGTYIITTSESGSAEYDVIMSDIPSFSQAIKIADLLNKEMP